MQFKVVKKEMGLTRVSKTFDRPVVTIQDYVKNTGTKTTDTVIGNKPV
jgi:hypothetical protein